MFCEKCGKKLPDQALFCDNCGYKIEIRNKVQPMPHPQMQPKPQPKPQPMPQQRPVAKKISLFTKVIAVEVIALVVLAGVFYTKMKEYTSPEMVAKEYFVSVMSGDTKKAYGLVEVDETEFVNETFFEKVVDQIGCKNISNYKVKKAKTNKDDYSKEIQITYRMKEDTQDYSFSVRLDKASDKKFFLFDQWKVNVGDYIQKDVSLRVLKDSKVKLEGIELGAKYFDSVDEGENDCYLIPKMFVGSYKADVTHDVYEDVAMSFELTEDDDTFYEVYYGTICIKPEIFETVVKQAEADFKSVWEGAVHQTGLNEISDLKLAEDNFSELSQEYEDLKGCFYSDDGTGLKKVNFSNFAVDAEEGDTDYGYPSIEVAFTAPFTCVSTSKDWWTGELEDYDKSGSYYGTMFYTNWDGEWTLRSMEISEIYYY
ncbi:MAG: zinc-ribbon domain-containing protein [Clostridiales bacterium]|nr:zinc-ribbon domain-containing protein [Clostridiales bacterium]